MQVDDAGIWEGREQYTQIGQVIGGLQDPMHRREVARVENAISPGDDRTGPRKEANRFEILLYSQGPLMWTSRR